jgi:DnaJ-domain-containing protein 1
MDENDLLDQLRELHREQPGDDALARFLARGLYSASFHQTIPEKAKAMLYELRYILDSLKF